MKRIEVDPFTGITETFIKDGDTIKVNQHQDLQPFIDANQSQRNNCGRGWKEEFHKVASIPPLIIEMWNNELKSLGHKNSNCLSKEHSKWFIAKLNSSDFLKLRTKEGQI